MQPDRIELSVYIKSLGLGLFQNINRAIPFQRNLQFDGTFQSRIYLKEKVIQEVVYK